MVQNGRVTLAGTAVGALEIVEELARGGFGIVYRARDRRSGAEVALKVLHPDLCQDLEAARRFDREIRVVQLIGHPNIVEILDVGALPTGEPYFSMELLEGRTLGQHIAQGGRLSGRETLEILEALASALEASHAKGVIHRDLKASNVFLADRVVLLDFGIAKLLEETGSTITSSRHVIGTPVSMAPEQIAGGPLGPATDVYGLGALTYLMLTAAPPFSHPSAAVLQQMQLEQMPVPPSELAPVSAALEQVVLRALAKAPGDRYPTPVAFAGAIRAALEATSPAAPSEKSPVTAVFIDLRLSVDAESADEALLAAIDDLLPAVCRALPDLDVVRSTGSSRLLQSREQSPREALDRVARVLETAAVPGVSFAVYARSGSRDEVLESLAWLPADSGPGLFVL